MDRKLLQLKKGIITSYAGIFISLITALSLQAQEYSYQDSWGENGFTLIKETPDGVTINFSIRDFTVEDQVINREEMKTVLLPGAFLQNNEGAPNLPGRGKYIASPQGAKARIIHTEIRTVTLRGLNISPAPKLPLVTDLPPLHFEKDINIYSVDAFYPAEPVILSPPRKVRGVDVKNLFFP